MQIVIDIPEETYKAIMLGKWDNNGLAFYVKIGTPLDDVKEEIEQDMSYDMFDDYGNKTRIHKELWEILDNIGKAESEDKE